MRRVLSVLALLGAPAHVNAQDAEKGKALFEQCAVCHKLQAASTNDGPSLLGVVGREAGRVEDFRYSRGMARAGVTWNEQQLDRYLADPQAMVSGTRMAFGGMVDQGERADLIAYLKTLR